MRQLGEIPHESQYLLWTNRPSITSSSRANNNSQFHISTLPDGSKAINFNIPLTVDQKRPSRLLYVSPRSVASYICLLLVALLLFLAGTRTPRIVPKEGPPFLVAARSRVPRCQNRPCFWPERIQVDSRPGFPSYWDYGAPMNVTFDGRSFMINNDRVLFLSGSMHPVRATPMTWELALDEAVRNGLNMITMYIMWASHQPFADQPIQWTLPPPTAGSNVDCVTSHDCWNVAQAVRSAANRGLFVHMRVGPYVCAEYSYGGIPEWLPLKIPHMDMRRPNQEWMTVMENYLTHTISYLRANKLFADQGGPIVMAQIENELGDETNDGMEHVARIDASGSFVYGHTNDTLRKATVQDYANWCGRIAQKLAPKVIWTMCNGLSANNTISTFNGDYLATSWLERNGDSGQIQVDQPALWTEDEGGFQIWGDSPNATTDYFWGRNSRDMAYNTLQWFARGGTAVCVAN
jgi:hypothetical protein